MLKITEMYAFVATDDHGDEGVMAACVDNTWIPLVGADMARVNSLIPLADEISKNTNTPYKILYFTLNTGSSV